MKFSWTLSFFLQFFLLLVIMNFANPASYKNISRSTINSIINGIPSAPRHFYSRLIFRRGNLNDVYYTTSYVPYLFPQFVGGGQMWMRWGGGRAKSGCVGVGGGGQFGCVRGVVVSFGYLCVGCKSGNEGRTTI